MELCLIIRAKTSIALTVQALLGSYICQGKVAMDEWFFKFCLCLFFPFM